MSERQVKAHRKDQPQLNGGQAPATITEQQPGEEPQPMSHPSVLIIRESLPNGGVDIKFMELNGIDPFAVPALLRAAANIREQQLGGGK